MLDGMAAKDCICFPVDEPPDLELKAEIEAAKAIRCPLHGERFSRLAPYVYRVSHSIRPVHLQLENCLDWHSPQYLKALKASFPPDRWPATEVTEPDGTVRFVLKDGTADEELKIRRMEFELKAAQPPSTMAFQIVTNDNNGVATLNRVEWQPPNPAMARNRASDLIRQ